MTTEFRGTYPVRFAHCDPAGIGYYPRLLEIVDAAIEDWTDACIGITRSHMHVTLGFALPTVDLHVTFVRPCRLGETLDIVVAGADPGRSSIGLTATISCAGEPRFAATYVQVLTDGDGKAMAWPEAWHARLGSGTTT
jgi:4-hydroxybenzoyl-CoA thioesterase